MEPFQSAAEYFAGFDYLALGIGTQSWIRGNFAQFGHNTTMGPFNADGNVET